MKETILIGNRNYDLFFFKDLLEKNHFIKLDDEAANLITSGRRFLEEKLSGSDTFYGINTGFGSLCDIRIGTEDIQSLQTNLVRSHACGMGDEVPEDVVSLIMVLKVINLSAGYSGVRLELVQKLVDIYNAGIRPVIYEQGSLGASGDLAPLAHMSLAILGEGDVNYKGERLPAQLALDRAGIATMSLESKEGLALLNGTQFSTAYGLWSVLQASAMAEIADMCGALSLDAFQCQLAPFDMDLHMLRPHPGQIASASAIRGWLKDSGMRPEQPVAIQDPYSFRCIPQVHGASRDAIAYVAQVLLTEVNSVTDNPSLFPAEDKIISGGNFHAQPIGLALDFLAIATAELGNISERRTFQLISGLRGLPNFLIEKPGLHSGMMIPQYTAASIVSQSKQLCTPASVDSIVSSAGQEDHVSMAANAGTKCYRVIENTWRVLSIEWMTAAQAIYLRGPLMSSPALEHKLDAYRQIVSPLTEDRYMSPDLHASTNWLKSLEI